MNIVISLLVYNQLEVTNQCIRSLLDNTISDDYLLVISDNASGQETADYLRGLPAQHPQIVYIRNDENLGYIGAHNNVFARYGEANYFCVLNNDLVFRTKGWDQELRRVLEGNPSVAQVGPVQEFGRLGSDGVGKSRNGEESLDYIGGACFMARSSSIHEAGGLFEDRYMQFAFCEDADLSLRLRNRGYQIAECSDIDILHYHNTSFKNEKVEVDFRECERHNNQFLRERWQKYFATRAFSPLKVLVERAGAMGDVLCTEPVLRELKRKYPCSELYVQTVCPAPLEGNPVVTAVGEVSHQQPFDLKINLNLAYEKRPLLHVVDAYGEEAQVILASGEKVPKYYPMKKHEASFHKGKPTLVACSEGSWASRSWPRSYWRDFLKGLQGKYRVLEVGANPAAYSGVGEDFTGKISLSDTLGLIAGASIYAGMDGGLMHFAQAMEVPVFAVFGCTCPNFRIHDWSQARVAWLSQKELSCAGCHHLREAPRCFTECDKEHVFCLENLTVERVLEEFHNAPYNNPPEEVTHV